MRTCSECSASHAEPFEQAIDLHLDRRNECREDDERGGNSRERPARRWSNLFLGFAFLPVAHEDVQAVIDNQQNRRGNSSSVQR